MEDTDVFDHQLRRRIDVVEMTPNLSLAQLQAALLAIAPEVFRERPLAAQGAISTSRADRLKVLVRRAEMGMNLFHSDDVVFLRGRPPHMGRRTAVT